MYARRNDPPRSVRVPENYGGNAFSGKERRNDLPPPIRPSPASHPATRHGTEDAMPSDLPLRERQSAPANEFFDTEEPHAPIGEEFFRGGGQQEQYGEEQQVTAQSPSEAHAPVPGEADRVQTPKESHPASLLSALLPPTLSSSHFPFGHGLGSEEILILAIMLLIFLSGNERGEVDNEALLLLGFLLFAG